MRHDRAESAVLSDLEVPRAQWWTVGRPRYLEGQLRRAEVRQRRQFAMPPRSGRIIALPGAAAGVFVRGRSGQWARFRASAPDALPILQRLGLAADGWLSRIESFGRLFRSAIGQATAPADFAASRSRRWRHGISAARLAFGRVRHLAANAGVASRLTRQRGIPPGAFHAQPAAPSPRKLFENRAFLGSRRWPSRREALGPTCNSGHDPVQ